MAKFKFDNWLEQPNAKLRYTTEEKEELIFAMQRAALSVAQLWDKLREIEGAHDCTIEIPELVDHLASEHDTPATMSLRDEDVWKAFLDSARIRRER